MKKAVLLLAIGIIGIGVIGYVAARGQQDGPSKPNPVSDATTNAKQPDEQDELVVTYDDNGFMPQELTVSKGSTVTFVNKSSIPLWVASNPHPEHTAFPEFDTAVALGRYPAEGENFTFTFDKAGTWEYHNHTASGDDTTEGVHPGTIIVKE